MNNYLTIQVHNINTCDMFVQPYYLIVSRFHRGSSLTQIGVLEDLLQSWRTVMLDADETSNSLPSSALTVSNFETQLDSISPMTGLSLLRQYKIIKGKPRYIKAGHFANIKWSRKRALVLYREDLESAEGGFGGVTMYPVFKVRFQMASDTVVDSEFGNQAGLFRAKIYKGMSIRHSDPNHNLVAVFNAKTTAFTNVGEHPADEDMKLENN